MQHFALEMFLLLRCFAEMTLNSSFKILRRQIRSHKRQQMQTNCKRLTIKAVLVTGESTDPLASLFNLLQTPIKTWSQHKTNLVYKKELLFSLKLANYFIKRLPYLLTMNQGNLYLLFFLPPKPDGTHRLILNLKLFSKSVRYEHFKMDTLWTVIRLMKLNCYMISIDIKDVIYSVPIAATDQKYLKFECQGKL